MQTILLVGLSPALNHWHACQGKIKKIWWYICNVFKDAGTPENDAACIKSSLEIFVKMSVVVECTLPVCSWRHRKQQGAVLCPALLSEMSFVLMVRVLLYGDRWRCRQRGSSPAVTMYINQPYSQFSIHVHMYFTPIGTRHELFSCHLDCSSLFCPLRDMH